MLIHRQLIVANDAYPTEECELRRPPQEKQSMEEQAIRTVHLEPETTPKGCPRRIVEKITTNLKTKNSPAHTMVKNYNQRSQQSTTVEG